MQTIAKKVLGLTIVGAGCGALFGCDNVYASEQSYKQSAVEVLKPRAMGAPVRLAYENGKPIVYVNPQLVA